MRHTVDVQDTECKPFIHEGLAFRAPKVYSTAPRCAAPSCPVLYRRTIVFSVALDTSALDRSFKSHAQRGIGRYVAALKHYFDARRGGPVEVGFFNHTSFASGRIAKPLLKVLPAGVNIVRQHMLCPVQLATGAPRRFDVVHFPAHMDAPAWSMKRCIVTVLDLIPLVLQELYLPERGHFQFHVARWLERRAIRHAALVLAISENTARDVHHLLDIPCERIVVTPLGVDERFHRAALGVPETVLRERYGIPPRRPLILYVGGIDQRKNYPALVETVRQLLASGAFGDNPPVLVMAGQIQDDRQYPKLNAIIAARGVTDAVILPGFVPDEDLLQLYTISAVFFFPSLYEGFGLPPLEAMAAGVPVVSSNTSCMPEILGNAAVFIDPHDTAAAAREIHALLTDPQRAACFRERGKRRARLFTWERTGESTVRAYELLARAAGLAA